jgi:hypothetical protein
VQCTRGGLPKASFLEESIDKGTQFVVFEPNDEATWARVRQSISNFLDRVWRTGALMGTTAEQVFFVRCDRTTMTQDDIENGRLICHIGVAPVKPAEFVIFRISQMTLEAAPASWRRRMPARPTPTGTRNDPFSQFRFLVDIPGVGHGAFSEVRGLDTEIDLIESRNENEDITIPEAQLDCVMYSHEPRQEVLEEST